MKVIFFDGVCGLCNGFVDFMMKIDKKNEYYFSPLQSEYASANLPVEFTKDLKSIVYLNQGKVFTRSEAVIKILSEVGGIWKLALIGKVLPKSFSDFAYNLVAQNRYKLFGKKETCRLPTPEERSRFVI
jgi:predicted DCC family thiol-disulfide oxidoreductase YuxK